MNLLLHTRSLSRLIAAFALAGAVFSPAAHAATPQELLSGYNAQAGSPGVPSTMATSSATPRDRVRSTPATTPPWH